MGLTKVNVIKSHSSLGFQKDLIKRATSVVDLSNMRGVRFCAEMKDFLNLKKNLCKLEPGISFLGAGDFHHLSLHFLDKLFLTPQLLLFDHHSDMMESPPGTISCGSWVRLAIREHRIKKCIVVGVNPRDEAFTGQKTGLNASFFPADLPHEHKVAGVMKEIFDSPEPVYISIDKDVLLFGEAFTNWDQGSMKLDELLDFLSIIKKAAKIVGADICGEWPAPADEIFHSMEDRKNIMKNQEANLKILNALEKIFAHQQKNSVK
ncbi:MAG: hypothetical protein PWR06_542 [Thermoanaerobacteraceae bacterium]|nr:hypothetical protein [Thermoanaerobacteraceae bacterium]